MNRLDVLYLSTSSVWAAGLNNVNLGVTNLSDTILYYVNSDAPTWHPLHVPHTDEYIADKYRNQDKMGDVTRWTT